MTLQPELAASQTSWSFTSNSDIVKKETAFLCGYLKKQQKNATEKASSGNFRVFITRRKLTSISTAPKADKKALLETVTDPSGLLIKMLGFAAKTSGYKGMEFSVQWLS